MIFIFFSLLYIFLSSRFFAFCILQCLCAPQIIKLLFCSLQCLFCCIGCCLFGFYLTLLLFHRIFCFFLCILRLIDICLRQLTIFINCVIIFFLGFGTLRFGICFFRLCIFKCCIGIFLFCLRFQFLILCRLQFAFKLRLVLRKSLLHCFFCCCFLLFCCLFCRVCILHCFFSFLLILRCRSLCLFCLNIGANQFV